MDIFLSLLTRVKTSGLLRDAEALVHWKRPSAHDPGSLLRSHCAFPGIRRLRRVRGGCGVGRRSCILLPEWGHQISSSRMCARANERRQCAGVTACSVRCILGNIIFLSRRWAWALIFHLKTGPVVVITVCISDLILMKVTELASFGFAASDRMKQTSIQSVIISLLRLIGIAALVATVHPVTLHRWILCLSSD